MSVRLLLLLLLLAAAAARAEIPLAERRSGYAFMGRDTRAMQDDDAVNPATLWVLDGEELWRRKAGAAGESCADCHALERMRGVAARYPAVRGGELVSLEQQVNVCRVERQKARAFGYESRELLSLGALIGRQSRGMPIAVEMTPQTRPYLEAGRALFERREGQLNLACSQCHDERWGEKLGGAPIPQAHPTGYPIYRLEWQALGSLKRRLRNCLVGMRTEAWDFTDPQYVLLELYLMQRARGLALDAPAVRP